MVSAEVGKRWIHKPEQTSAIGLPNSAIKITGCPVEFGFQISNEYFFNYMYVPNIGNPKVQAAYFRSPSKDANFSRCKRT